MPDARSYLYVPGDRHSFLAKALDRGADALIVDLEDAVAPADKATARETVRGWLNESHDTTVQFWIRVNSGDDLILDLNALAAASGIAGYCLAKTENAAQVEHVAQVLDRTGSRAGLMPLLESANAIVGASAIAAAPRVQRLQIGEADLAVDAGVEPGPMGEELSWARSAVVFASAAAGLAAPVAAVSVNFRDLDLFARSTEASRRAGFFGRACIHPAQVPVANTAFNVPANVADRARALLERHREAGVTTFVGPDGSMVDEAVLRAARRTVAQARG